MAAFALVSVLVTGGLAVVTWHVSSDYMTEQREQSAIRQTVVNKQLVGTVLRQGAQGLRALLAGLGAQVESAVILVDDSRWISSGTVDPQRLPRRFLATVTSGHPASQRVALAGSPVLAVGIPIRGADATYIEVFPLRELDKTLRFLSLMLGVAVAGSGVIGALLGRWAAARALHPLTRLTAAAAATAAGDLNFRMPQSTDRDLAPIAEAFNETAERLQQRVARDARFAGDVSHELRSPLTTMVNAMSVLERRKSTFSEPAQQAVELLATDLRRFKSMVEDLLAMSMSEQKAYGDGMEDVDLGELVTHAAAHVNSEIQIIEIDAEGPHVMADRRRLERVVANLLTNAVSHGGGIVRLAVRSHDGRARIEVDDAGPGVPDQDRSRIFERFARGSTAAPDHHDSGAGLGLALVVEHVRRHDGRIWVEDRPEGGARFIVDLPERTQT